MLNVFIFEEGDSKGQVIQNLQNEIIRLVSKMQRI